MIFGNSEMSGPQASRALELCRPNHAAEPGVIPNGGHDNPR
jgi:hypothetical protein